MASARWRRAERRPARKRLNGLDTSKCRMGKGAAPCAFVVMPGNDEGEAPYTTGASIVRPALWPVAVS